MGQAPPERVVSTARPLRADIPRAYLGLIAGLSVGLGLQVGLGRYDYLLGIVTAYLSPFAFLALFLGYGTPAIGRFAGRLVGAYGGWLGMWIAAGVTFPYVYQLGGPGFVLFLLAITFAAFTPAGLVAGDYTQTLIRNTLSRWK